MAIILENGLLGALFGDLGSSFGADSALPIDLVFEETETLKALVTNKPTQSGANFTDNIILQPVVITSDGMFKSEVIGDTWRDKKAILEELRRARVPFDIVTHLGVYPSMFFTEINNVVNNEFNSVLKFTATLQQIPVIEAESKEIPAEAFKEPSRGAPQIDTGKVQGEVVQETQSSVLYNILGL